MSRSTGFSLPLSLPRRLLNDHARFAAAFPSVPVVRRLHLADLADARAAADPRPSWEALFVKAFGLVAAGCPQLRRAYLPYPTPRLYQHPHTIATLPVERHLAGEEVPLRVRLARPETWGLIDLDAELRGFREKPLETIPPLRQSLRWACWPRPLRRLALWAGLHLSGHCRAHVAGTVAFSAPGPLGALTLHPRALAPVALSHGEVGRDGGVEVCLAYDPRVLDDFAAARALGDLEKALNHELLAEVRYFQRLNAA